MRRLMLLVAIFVMTVTALLLPVKKHEVEALAENLWTSDGWWKKHPPSTGWPVHRWERKEYGLKWAWLVVDSGISCDDWYAKVDPISHPVSFLLFSGGDSWTWCHLGSNLSLP